MAFFILTSYTITLGYCGSLLSFLTVTVFPKPMDSLKELADSVILNDYDISSLKIIDSKLDFLVQNQKIEIVLYPVFSKNTLDTSSDFTFLSLLNMHGCFISQSKIMKC